MFTFFTQTTRHTPKSRHTLKISSYSYSFISSHRYINIKNE